jgi:hypothetical protein
LETAPPAGVVKLVGADVTPVRGVTFGPPATQTLTVSVEVVRTAD